MSTMGNIKVPSLGEGSSPAVHVSSARFIISYKFKPRFVKADTSPTEAFTYCSLGAD